MPGLIGHLIQTPAVQEMAATGVCLLSLILSFDISTIDIVVLAAVGLLSIVDDIWHAVLYHVCLRSKFSTLNVRLLLMSTPAHNQQEIFPDYLNSDCFKSTFPIRLAFLLQSSAYRKHLSNKCGGFHHRTFLCILFT